MGRFCFAPWINLEVSMLGTGRSCCRTSLLAGNEEGTYTLGDRSLEDLWTSDKLVALRREFLAGKEPESCRSCWEAERHEGRSARLDWDTAANTFGVTEDEVRASGERPVAGPRAMSLNPGNTCTLRCVMCNPVKSSRIRSDKVATDWNDILPQWRERREHFDRYAGKSWWRDSASSKSFVEFMPTGVKRVYIAGGEPFITPWALSFMKMLAERPDAKDTILHLSTNADTVPKDHEFIGNFKRITVSVSIEGVGRGNDYIRFGSKWERVVKNIDLFLQKPNVNLSLMPSLQIHNMLYIGDVVRFARKLGIGVKIGFVEDPYYLNVAGAPQILKDKAIRHLTETIEEIKTRPSRKPWLDQSIIDELKLAIARCADRMPVEKSRARMSKFLGYISDLDESRSVAMVDYLPELSEAVSDIICPFVLEETDGTVAKKASGAVSQAEQQEQETMQGKVRHISTGSPFEAQIGYSRAVVSDGWVFVAGTTGYDYATMTMPESVVDQCRNALATIGAVLADAGASLDDVVRVTYILPDKADWPECWPATSEAFAKARPAATMFAAGLQEPEMKIEIEVTARLPG